MSSYVNLPIFIVSYDFVLRIIQIVSKFSKEYRYSFGERMISASVDLLIHIYRVNSAKEKIAYLMELNEKVQLVYLLLRLSHDLKLISTDTFASVVSMIDDVASQSIGWLKSNEKTKKQ